MRPTSLRVILSHRNTSEFPVGIVLPVRANVTQVDICGNNPNKSQVLSIAGGQTTRCYIPGINLLRATLRKLMLGYM